MPRAPDLAGRALNDRYELHALIGEGAFGRVYRGVDRRLARAVAVKVIKPWWAQDSAWVERFEREARLLARITDPRIVQIFDIGDAEDGPYYVAELVEGESLAERLLRGPLATAEAKSVAEQLCEALGGAHAQGVVHCDVKPANVLLAADGIVKVGDFGVARLAESTSQAPSATVAGTPRYMSPEQARGRPPTPATDVYSAGIVLYEMLTGEPPFAHGSAVELGLRHVQEQPRALPVEVPPALQTIVGTALAKDPADRYADGAEMAAALRAVDVAAVEDAAPAPRSGAGGRALATPHAAVSTDSPRTIDLRGAGSRETPAAVTRLLPRPAPAPPPGAPPPRRLGTTHRRPRAAAIVAAAVVLVGVLVAALVLSRGAGRTTVRVPGLVGQSSASAEHELARSGLRYGVKLVAVPGAEPAVVTQQTPGAAARIPRGSTVALSVAEAPRWRTLTSFSGVDSGHSVPFRILGSRWRVSYSMTYEDTCTLLVVCFGPSAEVEDLETGSSFGSFELGEGPSETHIYGSGPGLYRLSVSGGHDAARWSMTVADYY
ncbi:MAG TPA: serine/threonine-protein kinase [Solirubrobacteraceae bacterium]|nr:serine/threonine-protein kinase [Solirubrobacteraceae bacterium]